MSVPISDVLRALRAFPGGATTAQLASRLGMKPSRVANRLGKLWMYGGPVDRDMGRRVNGAHAQSVWRSR